MINTSNSLNNNYSSIKEYRARTFEWEKHLAANPLVTPRVVSLGTDSRNAPPPPSFPPPGLSPPPQRRRAASWRFFNDSEGPRASTVVRSSVRSPSVLTQRGSVLQPPSSPSPLELTIPHPSSRFRRVRHPPNRLRRLLRPCPAAFGQKVRPPPTSRCPPMISRCLNVLRESSFFFFPSPSASEELPEGGTLRTGTSSPRFLIRLPKNREFTTAESKSLWYPNFR